MVGRCFWMETYVDLLHFAMTCTSKYIMGAALYVVSEIRVSPEGCSVTRVYSVQCVCVCVLPLKHVYLFLWGPVVNEKRTLIPPL